MVFLMRDVRLGKFGGMSGDLSGMSLWLAGEADARAL
jgi:cobalamin synthase